MIFIKDKNQLIQALQKFDFETIITGCDRLVGLSNALGSLNDDQRLGKALRQNDLASTFKAAERLDCLTEVLEMLNDKNIIIAEKLDRSLSKIYSTVEWRRIERLDENIDRIEEISSQLRQDVEERINVDFRKYGELNEAYIRKVMARLIRSQEQFMATKKNNQRTIASIEKMNGANWYRQLGNIEINFAEAISVLRNILRDIQKKR